MRKLNNFNKTYKKKNIVIISAFLLTGIILAGISYSVYQKEDEVLFINAKVGSFDTSNSDIEIAIRVDGEDVDIPPSKNDGYYNVSIECDYADGIWESTDDKWGAYIYNISSNRVKCNVNFESYELFIKDVELGDYISMTPTSTSYTISSSLTGYSSNQTINPNELNMWRVIKKNEDGTVEVVSEYVSSKTVYFRGQTGYMNYVGALNIVASQYTNPKYVLKTRHIGYSNQIEKCSVFSATGCPMDNEYKSDINIVRTAIGTVGAGNINNSLAKYYLASRYIHYDGGNLIGYYGRFAHGDGLSNGDLWSPGSGNFELGSGIRPIVTLKTDLRFVSGDGKSVDTAYQFE